MDRSHRRRFKTAARRRAASAFACERLEYRAVLAVTWPATAPAHDLIPIYPQSARADYLEQIYVNQFGDARIDNLVIGPAGERLTAAVAWNNSGFATATTTGPLETEMAWYGPISGYSSDAGLGAASITQDVEFNDLQTISIAGRNDVDVGHVGLAIDGPASVGIQTIDVQGDYNEAYGSTIGDIFSKRDYRFYRFTAPWTKVWNVNAWDLGTRPTMVVFDSEGNPIGGTFLTALSRYDDTDNTTVRWSGEIRGGEEIFIRIDGTAASTGSFSIDISGAEQTGELWVTTAADSGVGSLRWAIEQANIWPDHSTIWLAPTNGNTLNLLSDLPELDYDTTFRFAPGVTSFTIDQGLVPQSPDGTANQWVLGGSGRISTLDAPMTLRNVKGTGVWFTQNSDIQGLTIIGAPGVAGTAGIFLLSPWHNLPFNSGSRIRNNVIEGMTFGMALVNVPGLDIDSNHIRSCQNGIFAGGALHGTSITDNVFERNDTGIAAYGLQGVTIGGNEFIDNVKSGIYFSGSASDNDPDKPDPSSCERTGVFSNTFVRNNVGVTFDKAQNVLVGGTPASQGNTITADGNTALFQYRAGLYGLGDLTGSIALNTTINTPFLGINLAQAQGLTIANTIVRNHSGLGLVAQGQVGLPGTAAGLAGTVISGLTVERTGALPPIETAGVVLIDATGMRLESGNFSGDTTAIFVFNAAAGLVIVDNVFAGRSTGVGLFQAKNLAFGQIGRGNTIQNASGAGIYTGGNLAGTSVVANRITGSPTGIVLDNTTNLAIGGVTASHGNTITGTGNSTGIWARLVCAGTSIKKTVFSAHAANTVLGASTGITFQP